MSTVAWISIGAFFSCIACGGADPDTSSTPASPEPREPARGADGTEASSSSEAQPGNSGSSYTLFEGASGLELESVGDGTRRSWQCDRGCEVMCGSCLYEACMANGGSSDKCDRSLAACVSACAFCPPGESPSACYSPCLKGEPRCYVELDIIMPDDLTPDDVRRPEVTPDEGQVTRDDGTPSDDGRPSAESTPSEQTTSQGSSSSAGSSRSRY
jgi:hypothetical protein